MRELFLEHLQRQLKYIWKMLESSQTHSLIIDSGTPLYYFQDDQPMPFKSNPNFRFLCPAEGPQHILQVLPGQKTKLYFYSPDDFWHETSQLGTPFWGDGFEISIHGDLASLWKSVETANGSHIYLGDKATGLPDHNLKNPSLEFLSALHWARIQKSEYEIHCIRSANQLAAKGHVAAREAFFQGLSEKEINFKYMEATGLFQNELPYQSITALDEKAAVLHYHGARDKKDGKVFLIDAGARFNGYCSDITRTYCTDQAHTTFKDLILGLEKIQKNISVQVLPGFSYPELHSQAARNIGKLLLDTEIFQNITTTDIESLDLVGSFFPHGLGHSLGIQVHDVGGKQLDAQGTPLEADSKYPHLRTLRHIQENDVVTIEPGIYFIPMLLDPLRDDPQVKEHINWSLVDMLIDHGGIRIEDNIIARSTGSQNLTREFLN